MKYEIEITETFQRTVEVEADSLEDAIIAVRDQYSKEEIVLDAEDYVDTKIDSLEQELEIDQQVLCNSPWDSPSHEPEFERW